MSFDPGRTVATCGTGVRWGNGEKGKSLVLPLGQRPHRFLFRFSTHASCAFASWPLFAVVARNQPTKWPLFRGGGGSGVATALPCRSVPVMALPRQSHHGSTALPCGRGVVRSSKSALPSASPFGPEPLGPELVAEGRLTAEGLRTGCAKHLYFLHSLFLSPHEVQ